MSIQLMIAPTATLPTHSPVWNTRATAPPQTLLLQDGDDPPEGQQAPVDVHPLPLPRHRVRGMLVVPRRLGALAPREVDEVELPAEGEVAVVPRDDDLAGDLEGEEAVGPGGGLVHPRFADHAGVLGLLEEGEDVGRRADGLLGEASVG